MGYWVAKFKTKVQKTDNSIVDILPGDKLPDDVKAFPNNIHLWFDYVEELRDGKQMLMKGIEDVTDGFKRPVMPKSPKLKQVDTKPKAEEKSPVAPKESVAPEAPLEETPAEPTKAQKKSKIKDLLAKKKVNAVEENE